MRYLDVFYSREMSSSLNQMANTPMQDRWRNRTAAETVNMFATHMAHPTFLPRPELWM
jgi:hypothetical protein